MNNTEYKEKLGKIKIEKTENYLTRKGWKKEKLLNKASIWEKKWTQSDEPTLEAEILLPLNSEIGDFILRMDEVLETLAFVESRTKGEIIKDLVFDKLLHYVIENLAREENQIDPIKIQKVIFGEEG